MILCLGVEPLVAVDAGQQRQGTTLFQRLPPALEQCNRLVQGLLGIIQPPLTAQQLPAVGQHMCVQPWQALDLRALQREAIGVERGRILRLALVAVADADQEPHGEALVGFFGGEVTLGGLAVQVDRHRQLAWRQTLGHGTETDGQFFQLELRVARQGHQARLESVHCVLVAVAREQDLPKAMQQDTGQAPAGQASPRGGWPCRVRRRPRRDCRLPLPWRRRLRRRR